MSDGVDLGSQKASGGQGIPYSVGRNDKKCLRNEMGDGGNLGFLIVDRVSGVKAYSLRRNNKT